MAYLSALTVARSPYYRLGHGHKSKTGLPRTREVASNARSYVNSWCGVSHPLKGRQ